MSAQPKPRRAMKRRSRKVPAVIALAAGFGVAGWFGYPAGLRALGLWAEAGADTIPPTIFSPPPTLGAGDSGEGVVGFPGGAKLVADTKGVVLSTRINALNRKDVKTAAWLVTDATGRVLAENGATSLMTPASTVKILTALTALDSMPAEERFSTRVLEPKPGSIVLTGGGDPYLTTQKTSTYPRKPSLQELAEQTSAALKEKNQTKVTLGFDAGLFSGPNWAPTWEAVFEYDVTRISALMADGGVDPKSGARTKTPAFDAATKFSKLLTAQGITVTGELKAATGSGTELASVRSLPLRVLIQQALLRSDNTATEMILRQAAKASGKEASFTGGVATIREHLTKLGIWQDGAVLHDGSGISRSDRVSPKMLAGVIREMLEVPKYRPLLDALPVAGATGTLRNRFDRPEVFQGRGWVRGKTGSLRDVATLAGFSRSADGQNRVLVFMANDLPSSDPGKRWIDEAATTVAKCGCQ